ncbi:MAG: hypothetical protein R2744_04550 [Bacteroidales bacterium]
MNDTFSDPVVLQHQTLCCWPISQTSGGINTTGTGIGHDIVAYLDDDRTETTVLNNYFENDPGSYTSDVASSNLQGVWTWGHLIFLKAWDNYNNSGTEELKFIVETEAGLFLTAW